MLVLIPWLLMSCIIKTEGLTVTSTSSSPIINGSSVNLTFCNYSLSSGESINAIQWKFNLIGASSLTTMATYDTTLGFEAQGSYGGILTRPDSNSGFLLHNSMTLSDSGNYSCEIVTNLGRFSSDSVETVYVLPSGSGLDFPCNGSVNQVHNCSLADIGEPPATLTLTHSSGGSTASNTTGIVQLRVTSPGNVTCTVTLTGFPTYNIGIPPVTCPVNASPETTTAASVTITPTSVNSNTSACNCTCICHCPCHCPTVFGLVITLAIVTAALSVCIIVIRCSQGGTWELGNGRRKLGMKEWVTIILMVVAVAFIIAVGVYTLSSERNCHSTECCGKSCCADACCAHACCPNTCCPDAYKASIAFVVIGSAEVITAIIVLMLSLCCFSKRPPNTLESTMGGAEVDMKPTKPSAPRSTLGSNGNSNTTSEPSPGRRLPPLVSPTEKTGNVTEQPGLEKTKKKKKSKKDQPETTEERPLPTPKQDDKASKTQRRTSMDASVNMSGSNNSPLPMRSNFTPGNQASGPSEGVMPPVGSSSLKR